MGKEITTEEFDKLFDEGHDITPYLDMGSIRRPGMETRKVNIEMPAWMIRQLDREAARLAIPRQAVAKMLIDEGLERRGLKTDLPRRVVTRCKVGDEVVTVDQDIECIHDEKLLDQLLKEG